MALFKCEKIPTGEAHYSKGISVRHTFQRITEGGLVEIKIESRGTRIAMGARIIIYPASPGRVLFHPDQIMVHNDFYYMIPEKFRAAVKRAHAENIQLDGSDKRSFKELESLDDALAAMEKALSKPKLPSETKIIPVVRNEAQSIAMQQNATDETASENRELKAKVELLREMVDDLRQRLDKSEDERRATQTKLTLILTDQRAKPEPPRTGLWQRLFGGK